MAANPQRRRRIEFNTGKVIERGRRVVAQALDDLVQEMNAEFPGKIDTPYPPASAPGQYPHKRTGRLQARTQFVRQGRKIIARTTNVGAWLQSGTRKMRPRKFVREFVAGDATGRTLRPKWRRRANALIRQRAKAL